MLSSLETCLNQDCDTIINGRFHAHIHHDLSPREMKDVLDAGSLIAKISLLISQPLYLTTAAGAHAVIGLCTWGWWIRQLMIGDEICPMLAVVLYCNCNCFLCKLEDVVTTTCFTPANGNAYFQMSLSSYLVTLKQIMILYCMYHAERTYHVTLDCSWFHHNSISWETYS